MLLQGSAEYISQTKEAAFFDLFPLSHIDEVFPIGKPRILNTHFSLDVLPQEFKGRKTVIGMCLMSCNIQDQSQLGHNHNYVNTKQLVITLLKIEIEAIHYNSESIQIFCIHPSKEQKDKFCS